MHCPECKCTYGSWTACPICKIPLVENVPPDSGPESDPISYEALVEQVRTAGGQLTVELSATDVGVRQTWGFPFRGYGFAWVKRMQGDLNSHSVDMNTTEVVTKKRYSFPYFGHGYAWSKGMQGTIAGHEATLVADKVSRKRNVDFPWRGYGSAWTEERSGKCGEQLDASLVTTEVGKKKGGRFPYFGFGYAWARKGVLTLTLVG